MSRKDKREMSRYPVFSCPEVFVVDEFQTFRDESLVHPKRNMFAPQLYQKKRNNKIVNIYNKIMTHNNKDPLFPRYKKHNLSQNKHTDRSEAEGSPRKEGERTVEKFVGELINSLSHTQEVPTDQGFDSKSHQQKVNLLKRIIEHYNIKSMTNDNYSNLIKTFGLPFEDGCIESFTIKKNLHPRRNTIRINPKSSQGNRPISKHIRSCLKTIESKTITISRDITTADRDLATLDESLLPTQSFIITPTTDTQITVNTAEGSKDLTPRHKMFSIQSKKQFLKNELSNSNKLRKSLQNTNRVIHRPFKRNSDSLQNLETKISKYREFLFILNLSNSIYKELDINKYERSFKFYVGKGNNGNMIKSLMKRRFWFEQTNSVSEADFIWTQLKQENIYTKQQSAPKIEPTQEAIKSPSRSQQKIKGYNRFPNCNTLIARNSFLRLDSADPICKIITNKQSKDYFSTIQLSHGLKKKKLFNERVKGLKKSLRIMDIKEVQRIHNHLPFNGFLGNKKAMFYCLRQYCRLTQKDVFDIVPLTFHIKKGYLDEQFKTFMSHYLDRKKNNKTNVWIMKPGQFSNRGQGITCSSKIEQIRRRVAKCKASSSNQNRSSTLIIQSYIANPLLYNYRKFDIRVFMLVTSHNGKIRAYWYQEGYIRTSSFQWQLNSFQDRYLHLTNDAVQKNCYQYGKYEPGNKLSFSQLQRYLDTLPSCGRNMDFIGSIYPQIKEMATTAFKSTYLSLDPKRLCSNFELFGLDFMLDDRMKPWLIQVNTNPCLQLNCPLLERIIPHMVENALRISLDPLFPPPSNYSSTYKFNIPQNALHYNKFDLIFDQERDGPELVSLLANSTIYEQIDDVDEDKQQFQEEGEQLDLQDI